MSNMWTLNIKKDTGLYYCFRCGNYGNWYKFVQLMLGENITDASGNQPKI